MPAPFFISKLRKWVPVACVLVFCLSLSQRGQGQVTEPKGQDDVLRVFTELVQTDVMVFDRQGNFVNGLKREDFELRIDGKVKPVEFFQRITAGSGNEEGQLAAARGSATTTTNTSAVGPVPLDRGRTVFFYIDDLHLDLGGMNDVRKLITRFIDKEMGQNDEAAIASASGEIGFLQQLTSNKTVLRSAVERLRVRASQIRDFERPPMTEYQALMVSRSDRDITTYFVDEYIRMNPGMSRDQAESMVTTRARVLMRQSGFVTTRTLAGLEGLIRGANQIPGRKLLFFISGGFLIDDVNSDTRFRLQKITSAAARNGIVIYSIDARGLVASLTDASSDIPADPTGVLTRAGMFELTATQDAMHALASDTGGRATFNTNALERGVTRALKETSVYYLLAWKPEEQSQRSSKFRRIEVKVIGKPNLVVQVRRGFFDREPETPDTSSKKAKAPVTTTEPEKPPVNTAESELRKAMLAPYPKRDIPVLLNLSYTNTPARGPLLSVTMQVPNEFLSFQPVESKQIATVAVAGTVFNDKGTPGAGFSDRLTIDSAVAAAAGSTNLTYGYPLYIGPGLYQVRVGVRDEKAGRNGTAHGWIEIPNLATGKLAMSSLLLGVRAVPQISNASTSENPDPVELSIGHTFTRNGYLRFLVFVYNAALTPTEAKPDVAIQVQVIRDGQPVITTALKKVSTENIADLKRVPYAAEISLGGLPVGQYVLQVTSVDRVTKTSASQQTRFDIQ